MKKISVLRKGFLTVFALTITGCLLWGVPSEAVEDKSGKKEANQAGEDNLEEQTQQVLSQMTLEEKVAQLFFIMPESLTAMTAEEGAATIAGEKTKKALEEYPVGGIIYFKSNLVNEEQTKKMIEGTKSYSKYPLFVGVDEEGGTVARIGNNTGFQVPKVPNMWNIGHQKNLEESVEKAAWAGETIGTYLGELGFNVDFAPVADLWTNSQNTVIGKRSYHDKPEFAGACVAAEVKALQDKGISAAVKHFPGHGDTAGDSHEGYVYTNKTMAELEAMEFIPFIEGIKAGTDFLMVGHITTPNATRDGLPASMSKEIIDGVIREKLSYDGIVITDSLTMDAISAYYSSSEACIQVLQAGGDMLLMPRDFREAYTGVLQAVQSGVITEERIDQSVRRILRVKIRKNE